MPRNFSIRPTCAERRRRKEEEGKEEEVKYDEEKISVTGYVHLAFPSWRPSRVAAAEILKKI